MHVSNLATVQVVSFLLQVRPKRVMKKIQVNGMVQQEDSRNKEQGKAEKPKRKQTGKGNLDWSC